MVLGWNLVLYRPVCKIHTPLFRNSGTTGTFDLKFWPVIGINHLRRCAKFQVGHLRGSYFTDRSVFYPKSSLSGQPPVRSGWNFDSKLLLSTPNTGPNFKSIPFVNPKIWKFGPKLGKKGYFGPVCKIHVYSRWQKNDSQPQNFMSNGVCTQNLSQKFESEKKLEGVLFLQVSKFDDVIK